MATRFETFEKSDQRGRYSHDARGYLGAPEKMGNGKICHKE